MLYMFCGEYSHSLDSKKRLVLPSKLREQLGTDVVMTKSVDKCISLYTAESWKNYCEKLDLLPLTKTRQVKRFLYASAFETSVDSQSRILISQGLCEYASLDKNVVVIGVGDHVEIWDALLWENERLSENADDIAETLAELGL